MRKTSAAKGGLTKAKATKSSSKTGITKAGITKAGTKKAAATKVAKVAKTAKPKSLASAQSRALLAVILKMLDADKAEEIVSIDMSGRTPMADFMVVASGRSSRHVAAIAEHLTEALRGDGLKCRVEGLPQGDWVLIDAVDVIVHVFRPEVRDFYNLEQMWRGPDAAAQTG